MHDAIDDCAKRRLTDRMDILTAVNILRSRGFHGEDLTYEMTRIFYVDLDEFNYVLNVTSGEVHRPSELRMASAFANLRAA